LNVEQIQAAHGDAGLSTLDEDGNDFTLEMSHGAIRWRPEFDKMRHERIAEMTTEVRAEVDRYRTKTPRLGDVPLFPMHDRPPELPEIPLTRNVATNWLRKAEEWAGLPHQRGGLWHAYRRLWATERKHLPDVDVAEVGGWTGTIAMKQSYQGTTRAGRRAASQAV
jgi:hypothetical protein